MQSNLSVSNRWHHFQMSAVSHNFFWLVRLIGSSHLTLRPDNALTSGRKNVLRKLLRILYRRLKAGFSVC